MAATIGPVAATSIRSHSGSDDAKTIIETS
jgi:hypothetical protein